MSFPPASTFRATGTWNPKKKQHCPKIRPAMRAAWPQRGNRHSCQGCTKLSQRVERSEKPQRSLAAAVRVPLWGEHFEGRRSTPASLQTKGVNSKTAHVSTEWLLQSGTVRGFPPSSQQVGKEALPMLCGEWGCDAMRVRTEQCQALFPLSTPLGRG